MPFVTRFNASGSALVYSTYLGGNGGVGLTPDWASRSILSATPTSLGTN